MGAEETPPQTGEGIRGIRPKEPPVLPLCGTMERAGCVGTQGGSRLPPTDAFMVRHFPKEGTPEFDRLCDNLHKEARMWGGWKTPVKVNEWRSHALKKKGMSKGKVDQFVTVALGIFLPLNGLVKELRKI